MATKRTPIRRDLRRRITADVVEAYCAGDYTRLHRLLRLRPWHPSPLPLDVTALGVDQDEPPAWDTRTCGERPWNYNGRSKW